MIEVTVLGIGNILMRDEGIGVRVLERVREGDWPDDVEFIDGGAGGMNLLHIIEEARRLVVFDAAEMHLPPGEFRTIRPEQIGDEDLSGRVSLHQAPFVETLRLCEEFSRRPDDVTILAIEPGEVDYGRDLSPALAGKLDQLVQAGAQLVRDAIGRSRQQE